MAKPKYDHGPLEALLWKELADRTLGQSIVRLTIPAFMVPKAEIAVFKTDHHPDYKQDHVMAAWEVCRATSAAPTFFAPHVISGRGFVDGGLWANNPILVAVTEALSCFDITPSQLRILSIGSGSQPYEISLRNAGGGLWHWRDVISCAGNLSTSNFAAQVSLMVGMENVVRLEPPPASAAIDLDDWQTAVCQLPEVALAAFSENRERLTDFFSTKAEPRHRFYTNS